MNSVGVGGEARGEFGVGVEGEINLPHDKV